MNKKDWHPASNGFVWDLVHPSLYCLVFGVTRRTFGKPKPWREWLGSGEIVEVNNAVPGKPRNRQHFLSRTLDESWEEGEFNGNYQWIPSEVIVDSKAQASIITYINNLHPLVHRNLHHDIEKILSKFVPLFERVLTDMMHPKPSFHYDPTPNVFHSLDDMENLLRDVPRFSPHTPRCISLKGRKLQVMIKLANFELTPERPHYPGGTWHVEALRNESIVAIGIYYYQNDNITESQLNMRQAVEDLKFDYDNTFFARHYGTSISGELGKQQTQELGAVNIREGMGLAFPNTYQHRVSPFELIDKTKDGSRKILVFFLVDPSKLILSTKDIPPQQRDWMIDELAAGDFPKLPRFVVEKIFDYVGWAMTLNQAKDYRQNLVAERTHC